MKHSVEFTENGGVRFTTPLPLTALRVWAAAIECARGAYFGYELLALLRGPGNTTNRAGSVLDVVEVAKERALYRHHRFGSGPGPAMPMEKIDGGTYFSNWITSVDTFLQITPTVATTGVRIIPHSQEWHEPAERVDPLRPEALVREVESIFGKPEKTLSGIARGDFDHEVIWKGERVF